MSNNSTSRRSFRDLFGQRMLCRLNGLLTLCWFTVAAQALYAQNPVISLTLKNATVREVIEAVKTQSGYSFWYRESEIDLRKRVSVEAHDQNVLKLLDGVLADQGILAKLEGRHIVLYKSDPAGRGREYQLKGRVETEAGDPIVGANVLVDERHGDQFEGRIRPERDCGRAAQRVVHRLRRGAGRSGQPDASDRGAEGE